MEDNLGQKESSLLIKDDIFENKVEIFSVKLKIYE